MRVVQIGDLTHDLHLSIFPSLVSDRRSEPIINHSKNTMKKSAIAITTVATTMVRNKNIMCLN